MKLLEMICRELGVEIGEHWLGNDGMKYTIGKTGKIFQFNKNGSHIRHGYNRWEDIFTGKLKPAWKPKEGEIYYTPYLNYNFDGVLHNRWEWHSISESSKWHDKLGIVFQTKEEAEECATNMIELAKNGI